METCSCIQVSAEVLECRDVVIGAHINKSKHIAAISPEKCVVAEAHANFARHLSASNRDTVRAATDTDVAANAAARNAEGVIPKPGNQIPIDLTTTHREDVVVELHINATDTPPSQGGHITVIKAPNDPAATHHKHITTITLGQGVDLSISHTKHIDAMALLHSSSNHPAINLHPVITVTLIHNGSDRSALHHQSVDTTAKLKSRCGDVAPVGHCGAATTTCGESATPQVDAAVVGDRRGACDAVAKRQVNRGATAIGEAAGRQGGESRGENAVIIQPQQASQK